MLLLTPVPPAPNQTDDTGVPVAFGQAIASNHQPAATAASHQPDPAFEALRGRLTAVFTKFAGSVSDGELELRFVDVNAFNVASGVAPTERDDFEQLVRYDFGRLAGSQLLARVPVVSAVAARIPELKSSGLKAVLKAVGADAKGGRVVLARRLMDLAMDEASAKAVTAAVGKQLPGGLADHGRGARGGIGLPKFLSFM